MPKIQRILTAKQKKGKHDRWDHNEKSLGDWKKGTTRRSEKRKRDEEQLSSEGLNAKLDLQMTDVYKRVEKLDEENWTKKQKKDRMEAEFVRLGGIPLKPNKCSFNKYLERVQTKKQETAEKISLEEETGMYDLVEGSKVKERRRQNILKSVELTVNKKKMAAKEGYIHRTVLGRDKRGEITLDKKRLKQMEIRGLKRRAEGAIGGRKQSRGSMWDDKYDINRYNDPKKLNSGSFDQMGSTRNAKPTRQRTKSKKRKR
eukprot:TRINITY_DN37232_c0_g1_i1.p1 TRINITY_DN37232_c0_g1~~TRINITY_DN37232_c0_g1_i1.p1  ORF type:complete len:258 (+),score=78.54 TRINITY_DN37232_c0_g1_i1:62-835(+)